MPPPELCRPRRRFGFWQSANLDSRLYSRLPKLSPGSGRALIAEKTGFGGAPEEAKMVGEPSCEHL